MKIDIKGKKIFNILNLIIMKEYKVESLIYYSKLTFDSKHIAKDSKADIQAKLDEYASNGFKLVSTSSTNFGFAIYIYLYFEKDI